MKTLQNSIRAITATLLLSLIALFSYSQTGLIGQWHLDGNTNDASGFGHNGTIAGTVTQTAGRCGMAYHFDGSSYIDCGNVNLNSTGEFSVSVWVKSTDPYVFEHWRMVVSKLDGANGGPLELFLGDGRSDNNPGTAGNYMAWNGGIGVYNVFSAFDLTRNAKDGNWHHLAVTFKSGSQVVYFDGVSVASGTSTDPLPNTTSNFHIGGIQFGSYHFPWIGDIDEVSAYNRALSSAEVQTLAQGCSSSTCANATSTSVTNITSTSATLNWVASVNPTQWQVQYRRAGTTKWTNRRPSGSARSITISSLMANRKYNWHIRAKCGTTFTAYSAIKSFTTLSALQLNNEQSISLNEADIEKSSALKLYPNPTHGQFVIDLGIVEKISTNAKIELVNMMGQTVYRETGSISSGRLQKNVSMLSPLSQGIYMVKVIVNDKVYVAKLIYEK